MVRLHIQSCWLMVNELGLLTLMEARTRGSAWALSSTPYFGTTCEKNRKRGDGEVEGCRRNWCWDGAFNESCLYRLVMMIDRPEWLDSSQWIPCIYSQQINTVKFVLNKNKKKCFYCSNNNYRPNIRLFVHTPTLNISLWRFIKCVTSSFSRIFSQNLLLGLETASNTNQKTEIVFSCKTYSDNLVLYALQKYFFFTVNESKHYPLYLSRACFGVFTTPAQDSQSCL